MSKKLYVGNLPYTVDDNQLSEIFSEAGAVESASVISDKFSGRSKGFGFVEFSNDDEGQAAIDKFNGFDVDGRAIVVNEARPMKPRDEGPRE
jgi:RNA recognition motif-containing protein